MNDYPIENVEHKKNLGFIIRRNFERLKHVQTKLKQA